MSTWLVITLLAGCNVDETGYDDVDTFRDADDGGVEGQESSTLYYASEVPLSEQPGPVTIIALPGTLEPQGAVTLEVRGRGEGVALTLVDGGFVRTVQAASQDVVAVVDETGTLVTRTLDDDLDGLASPGAGLDDGDAADSDAPGAPADTGDTAQPTPVTIVGGAVDVSDGALPWVAAPYLAYIEASGASALVVDAATSHQLPATSGDVLCTAALGGADVAAGLAVCLTL